MTWKKITGTAICAVALAACSVDGQAVDDSVSLAGEVDISTLDVGPYATAPMAPLGQTESDKDTRRVKGQRLVSHLVLGHEVDPQLTSGTGFNVIIRGGQLATAFVAGTDELPVNAEGSLLYGASMSAEMPETLAADGERTFLAYVLRYKDAATAKKAATDFAGKLAESDKQFPPAPGDTSSTKPLPGLPDTLVSQHSRPGETFKSDTTSTLTPYGNYLIHVYAKAPLKQLAWTESVTRTFLDAQKPLIDDFEKTPGVADDSPVDYDEHDILRYTLPFPDDKFTVRDKAVYTPRGIAHNWTDTRLAYDKLTEFSPYITQFKTHVYRSESDEKAEEFVAFLAQDDRSFGYVDDASPKGLPDATCAKIVGEYSDNFTCRVRVGRYVGQSSGDDLTDAQQQISAQYAILTKADQNAK